MKDLSYSFIIGERLKALRTEKRLSHEALSKALQEKYDISISTDSLQNYEVIERNHSKSYKNTGMKIEYLRAFSDFYGVSSDYILGLTDYRTPDPSIKAASQLTGLSETSIDILASHAWGILTEELKALEVLIRDIKYKNDSKKRHYRSVLSMIFFFLAYSNSGIKKKVYTNGTIVDEHDTKGGYTHKSICLDDSIIENSVLAEIQNALRNIKETQLIVTTVKEGNNGHD